MSKTEAKEIQELRDALRETAEFLATGMREELGSPEFRVLWVGDTDEPVPAITIRLTGVGEAGRAPENDETIALALQGVLEKLDSAATHGRHKAVAATPTLRQVYALTRTIVKTYGAAFHDLANTSSDWPIESQIHCDGLAEAFSSNIFDLSLSPTEWSSVDIARYVNALWEAVTTGILEKTRTDPSLPTVSDIEKVVQDTVNRSFDDLQEIVSRAPRALALVEQATETPRRLKPR